MIQRTRQSRPRRPNLPCPEPELTGALASRPKREGTKRALVIALLSREQGASYRRSHHCHRAGCPTPPGGSDGLAPERLRDHPHQGEDNRTVYRLAAARAGSAAGCS
jgi:hypothetical protein